MVQLLLSHSATSSTTSFRTVVDATAIVITLIDSTIIVIVSFSVSDHTIAVIAAIVSYTNESGAHKARTIV